MSRIENFLIKYNILAKKQFGFRHDRSTLDAIYFFMDKVIIEMENAMLEYFVILARHLIALTIQYFQESEKNTELINIKINSNSNSNPYFVSTFLLICLI